MAKGTISENIASVQFLKDKISAKERLLAYGIECDSKKNPVGNRYRKKHGVFNRYFFQKSTVVLA